MSKVEFTEKEINAILKNNNYIVEYINFQNNSTNGAIYKKNKKYFFKLMNKEKCKKEIKGYKEIKKLYPVPKLNEKLYIKNIGILVYEYDEMIKEDSGLLHDFLLQCEEKEKYTRSIIDNIFQYYDNALKTLKTINSYPMQEFYDKRVNSRLIKWYEDWKLNNYKIVINEKFVITLEEIIYNLKNFFQNSKEYLAFYSQGDPNTVNIGIKPIFMDLTTAGCNCIEAEIAAFIWSELIADIYFCPKYHSNSYKNHEKILQIYKKYEPNLDYIIDKEKKIINIRGKLKTSKIRKDVLHQYLDIYRNNNIKINSELKYYIIMRILGIFNVRQMEENDIMYSLLCVGIVSNLFEGNKNTLDIIEELLLEYTEEVKCGKSISRL